MLNKSMNGAEALIKALIENDVDTVFGYPGGAVLPVYDAIFKNCLLYTSPSPRDVSRSRMPSSA